MTPERGPERALRDGSPGISLWYIENVGTPLPTVRRPTWARRARLRPTRVCRGWIGDPRRGRWLSLFPSSIHCHPTLLSGVNK